jgi:hypothetical protein
LSVVAAGELITIPATRMGPEAPQKDAAISAEQAQANREVSTSSTHVVQQ